MLGTHSELPLYFHLFLFQTGDDYMSILHNDIAKKSSKTENNMSDLWTFLTKSDIIELDTEMLLEKIKMTKKEKHEQELLKQHLENFSHIWLNKKGLYVTYVPAADKPRGRKPLSATTKDKLNRKIIDFYLDHEREEQEAAEKAKEEQSVITLRMLYPKWLNIKRLETTATSYIRRIDDDWKKYYLNDPMIDVDITQFTKISLKEWALGMIKSRELTKTQYYNMSIIIRQALDYAVDSDYLKENPFKGFNVDGKLFRKVKKPEDNTQVFLTTERPLIEAEAWNDFDEKGCTSALAIPFAFQTGLRLGELVAIKDTDICNDGKYLHIQRMAQKEQRQRPDGTWYPAKWVVIEHTKSSAGDRFVYLTKEARRILKIIMDTNQENGWYHNGFLFIHGGELITPRAVDTRIRKYCDHININRKSTHKIRKSFISSLIDAGININEVRKQVGHEDERTTLHNYCFNRKEMEVNEADMEKALAS